MGRLSTQIGTLRALASPRPCRGKNLFEHDDDDDDDDQQDHQHDHLKKFGTNRYLVALFFSHN